MHADKLGRERHGEGDHQNGADDRHFDAQIVVAPQDDVGDGTPPDRQAGRQEEGREGQAGPDIGQAHGSRGRDARDDGNDYPGQRVVEDGGGEDELSAFPGFAIAVRDRRIRLTAGGVIVVGAQGGFAPGGRKLRRARGRIEIDLLVRRAEEFQRAFPLAAFGRDHGAPESRRLIAAKDAAREIIVGGLEAAERSDEPGLPAFVGQEARQCDAPPARAAHRGGGRKHAAHRDEIAVIEQTRQPGIEPVLGVVAVSLIGQRSDIAGEC